MKNENNVVKGVVTGIESYGIFVKIDDDKSGLIHISEISSKFVRNPADFANIGEEINVEVIGNNDDGNLKLSIKNITEQKKQEKKRRKIIETSLGFKTLNYKLPLWIEENLKNHKNNSISIDK
ncbi:MAG: S1 RNA-binding domain-containing protein [Lactobacillales bacterium]|nr:S1 RNA-binding domain-containing protein [Lactobacillales bacterium]